jgi:NAD dependent epimerase/dehydratase
MKRALVTGSDGFIGSHLVESLVRQGWSVRAFVFYNSFNSWGWLDHAPNEIKNELDIFAGDVRDPFGVKESMRGCDVVFHLASLIGIPYSYHSPQAYVETNISGTLNVLQAARELGAERVIQTSTSEVYGTARFVPMTEDHPLQGQSPYSATKIAADQLALSFHRSFGLNVGICRPFNTYGPRQSARAVIPTIISQLLAGNGAVRLGSVFPTRDFNYVEDTVRGFMAMAGGKIAGEVINFGSNFEISIGDTAKLIGELIGKPVIVETDEQRERPANSEVERLYADNSRAKAVLGWEPSYGGRDGLKRGLQKTIEWFSDPANLQRYKVSAYNI